MPLETLILGAICILALAVSTTSFVLLLAWRRDHPDIRRIEERVESVNFAHTELADRCHAWFRRESTRKARKKRQEMYDQEEDERAGQAAAAALATPANPSDKKGELRARLRALQAR